jgi:hypothetical protein
LLTWNPWDYKHFHRVGAGKSHGCRLKSSYGKPSYMVGFMVALPYFNWQYAQEYGFIKWIFFGEVVATVKGVVWPYFVATSLFSDPWSVEAKSTNSPSYAQEPPYVVHCTEPLPIFTLGENANPTKAQKAALCACIWKNLGRWEREVSQKIQQGEDAEISWLHKRAFPYRFGQAVKKCGGSDM